LRKAALTSIIAVTRLLEQLIKLAGYGREATMTTLTYVITK
jgi:hypothetical protein